MFMCSFRVQMKLIVQKQHASRFYSMLAYVVSLNISTIPLAIIDTTVFGAILYW